jgi:LPXTG-motif cell wall-anchored protein
MLTTGNIIMIIVAVAAIALVGALFLRGRRK